jgi:hypothetical protein
MNQLDVLTGPIHVVEKEVALLAAPGYVRAPLFFQDEDAAAVGPFHDVDARRDVVTDGPHRVLDESQGEVTRGRRQVEGRRLLVDSHLEPHAADAEDIAVPQCARHMRREADIADERSVGAAFVDEGVTGAFDADRRVPLTDARVRETDLASGAAADDGARAVEGERGGR